MDAEFNSQVAFIDENGARKEKIKKGIKAIIGIFFIGTFIGHIVTIVIGVPMFQHCFHIALVVMIIGSVLGFIQQVPEFFRNFVKLEPKTIRYVNFFYGFIITIRLCWLVASTVLIAKTHCDNIVPAWICVSVNWAILAFIVVILISVLIFVKFFKKESAI